MEIAQTGQTAAATAARKPAPAEAQASGAAATDFQTFLTLLTTQLQNQDPLKPLESTEFVAQLASFSTVEQQIRTNDRLDAISEALGGGASAGLAAWIGKEVRAPAKAAFAGVPIEIETTPHPEADRATLTVTNDFGDVVARRDIDPRDATIAWDGRDAMGEGQPHGLYAFTIERFKGETPLGAEPGQVFGVVGEIRIEDGAPVLVLEGGGKVAVEDVSAIR